jgi:type I restriction enzyme S subunit
MPRANVNQHVCILRPERSRILPEFLNSVLQSPRLQGAILAGENGSSREGLNFEQVGNLEIPLPSLPTQRAIANYLDRETGRIDGLVAAKERLLGLLAEKRRALITRAVTRGLDPNAPLRGSGIPWLGKVPVYWGVWQVKHLAQVGNGSTPDRGNHDYWTGGDIPWLNSSVVNLPEVTEADQFVTKQALRECHLPLAPSGSLLIGITGQGKTRGMAAVLSFPATINQHLAYAKPSTGETDVWYLRWLFFAAYDYLRAESDDVGGTKGALTCEALSALRLPVPPLPEQRAIVAHIATETAKLDALRAAAERTVALLKERRAALIAAAVTGRMGLSPIQMLPETGEANDEVR